MTRPGGFAASAIFEDSREPARMSTSASSTASGSSFARNAGAPPISVSVPISSSAAATRRTCWPRAVSPSTSRTSRPSSVSPPMSAMVSANRRLRFRVPAETPPHYSAEAYCNAASDIDRRDDQQHWLGPVPDPDNDAAHQNEDQRGAGTLQIEILEAPVAPRTDHQE